MLITDLAKILRIRVKEAPTFMLERLVRESAREFFRSSRAWRMDFTGAIVAGTDTYDLTLPTNALAHDMLYAKLLDTNVKLTYLRDAAKAYVTPDEENDGRKTEFITLLDTDTFQLLPPPIQANTIEFKVVLTLNRTATDIADAIVEEFEDTLLDGALYRLYEMPNETWSDIKMSRLHYDKFMVGTMKAKSRVEESRTPGVRTAKFSW